MVSAGCCGDSGRGKKKCFDYISGWAVAAPFGSGDGRRVRRIGAGDRWNNRRSAAKAGAARVDRERSARSRPTRDRSHRHAAFRGTRPVQPRHSLAPPVPSAVSARKSQNAENTLRHNVSNTWQLTKRSGVRILFGEPNISHFEILSGLLVNDAVPFTGKNGPYCRRAASLKLGPHRLLTCSDWLAVAFSR